MPLKEMLTSKVGPIPVWGWLGAATAGIGAWAWVERSRSKSASSGASSSSSSSEGVPDYVFQIQNQLPPEAGTPTKTTTAGKAKVPSVTGHTYTDASGILAAQGLRAARAAGEKDVGKVTSQSPKAGTEVTKGSTVTLSGKGPAKKTKKKAK
jgi:hypothetical protein